jgi:hypothetical protein
MAIDGVKIIDSDDAYDIYNDIVERYKDGIDVELIKKDWLNEERNFCTDELYTEIYWTALAYALWKIGHLDEDIKNKAMEIISKGASKLWNEIDERAVKARQKALNKLALQIQSENPKPIKKPKSVKRREPYFELGDVISIKFEDKYGICFVSDLEVRPRKIEYHIACARTLQNSEPTMDDFINSSIAYKKMNTEFVLETDCWFNHKDLGELLPYLKKIGRIKLKPYSLGVLSPADSLENFYDDITNESDLWPFKTIEISEIIEEILEN